MAFRAARLLAVAASACGLLLAPGTAGATAESPAAAMRGLEQGVLTDLNSLRRQHGLVPLRLSTRLSAAARQHSTEMAVQGYFSHDSYNGRSFDRRISRFYPVGKSRFWSVGENLLWSSPDVDAARALDMWIASPEHKRNMLNSRWREIGLSAVHVYAAGGSYGGREVTIVTADFGVRR